MTNEISVPDVKLAAVKKGVVALFVSRITAGEKFTSDGIDIVREDMRLKKKDCNVPIIKRYISMGDKWTDIQSKLEAAFNDSSVGDLHLMLEGRIKTDSLFYKELMKRYDALSVMHNRPSAEYNH